MLKELVAINSIYPNERELGDFLIPELETHGFMVGIHDIGNGRKNILAHKGNGGKSVLFYGHMDTVPLFRESEWKTDPFVLTEKDGNLYGLGASDMKAGIAAFIEATKDTDVYVKILLAVDEENISEGAWKAVQERAEFFGDVELIISAEPNFGLGLSGITTGRTGRSIYEVNFVGKPEHITRYKEAEDAIEKLGRFVSTLYSKRETLFKSPHTVAQVRKVEGEAVGMSVPGQASVEVEILLGSEDSVQDVNQVLQKFADGKVNPKPRKTPYLEGYHFKDFPYQEIIANIIEENTGQEMSLHMRRSVGEDNVLATLQVPVITWGPDGGNEHKPNEYVNRESLKILTKMYSQFLAEIVKNK